MVVPVLIAQGLLNAPRMILSFSERVLAVTKLVCDAQKVERLELVLIMVPGEEGALKLFLTQEEIELLLKHPLIQAGVLRVQAQEVGERAGYAS